VHNEKRIKNKKAISDEFSSRKVDPLIIAMMHTSAAVNELNTMKTVFRTKKASVSQNMQAKKPMRPTTNTGTAINKSSKTPM
jgi:hypothetical protein